LKSDQLGAARQCLGCRVGAWTAWMRWSSPP